MPDDPPERSGPATGLALELLSGTYAACRLDSTAAVPDWSQGGDFCAITRTREELSIVCPDRAVPRGVRAERGWRCLRVAGRLDFGLAGIAAALTGSLAAAGISLLLIATYDTDYLLVREEHLAHALAALTAAGHRIEGP